MNARRSLGFAASLLLAACATVPRVPPPSPAEIVQLVEQGTPPEAIVARIRESGAVYRLPASQLARLREQGVPDAVIDAMQRTYLEDERWRAMRDYEWYAWRRPYPFYGPWPYWPYWRHPRWG